MASSDRRDRWLAVKDLLARALELEGDARTAFLAEECAEDPELRVEVEDLISSSEETRGFLDQPVVPAAPGDGPGVLAIGEQVGPYEILAELGTGGFSVVYGAQQEQPIRRRVAVKVIKPGMDSSQILQRFAAEREALALMEHENIARVLDAGETEQGRPFVVMEWVEGLPFGNYCDEQRLGIRERIDLVLQACSALEHAHQKGVVHRDIKPSNVLVANRDGEHVVKVIDFGIAKALQNDDTDNPLNTQTGMLLGTPEYMSPEQAGRNAADVDTRSDVYALGVLLYETLTGVRPFAAERMRGAPLDEVIRMIREEDPPRPSTRREAETQENAELRKVSPGELSRSLKGDLDWIVMKALAKEPDERYASVGAFADDLRRHLNHEPVSAGPPRLSYRLSKFVRRKRALAAGLAVAVLAIFGGATAAGIGFFQARAAEAEERAARLEAEGALDEARNVGDFLSDLLESVRPEEVGREAKVRDLLDTADLTALSSPRVEARLREVVGNAYRALGVLDRAESELTRAHAIAVAEEGKDSSRAIKLDFDRLVVRLDQSKERDLVAEVSALVDRATKVLGPKDPVTLRGRASKVSFLLSIRRLEEAVPEMLELLPLLDEVHGPDSGTTLSLLNNLSLGYVFKRDFENAEKYARMSLARASDGREPDHPRVMLSARALAVVLFQQRKWDPALEILRPLAERMRRVYGPDHFRTLGVENYVGFVLQQMRKHDEAIEVYERVVPLQDKTLGKLHRQSMMAVHNLGMLRFSQKKIKLAEPLLRDALARFAEYRGAEHFETAVARFHLGDLLTDLGKHDEALTFLAPALEHLVAAVDWRHPMTKEACTAYVRGLDMAGKSKYQGGDKRGAVALLERAWKTAEPLGEAKRKGLAVALAGLYGELGEPKLASEWRQRASR